MLVERDAVRDGELERLRAQLVRVEAPGEGLGGDHVLRKVAELILVGDLERRRLVDRRALVLCVDLVERDRAEGDARAVVLQPGDLDGLLELDPGAEYAGVVDLGRVRRGRGEMHGTHLSLHLQREAGENEYVQWGKYAGRTCRWLG